MFALGKVFRLLSPFHPMLIAYPALQSSCTPVLPWELVPSDSAGLRLRAGTMAEVRCVGDAGEDDEDPADEEDLSTSDPDVDEESTFDDFDDEFDDDFEEEENDPDWDHPEDTESDEPPPAKGPGKKK